MYTVVCFHNPQYYFKKCKEENKIISFFIHAYILGGFSFNYDASMNETLVHSLLKPYSHKLIH